MSSLPNVFSILMGIVSDSRPIFGYRRRPYLVFGWIMSTTAYSVMAVMGLPEPYFCVGPDGDYLLDQEPCNPDADQYLSRFRKLFVAFRYRWQTYHTVH